MGKVRILVVGLILMFIGCTYSIKYNSIIGLDAPISPKTNIRVNLPEKTPQKIERASIVKAITDDLARNVFVNFVETDPELLVVIDVDQPLSPTSFRRDDAYAVIIGITDYRSNKIPEVKYATRHAESIKDYLVNICGIPEENIILLTDDKATGTDLTAYIEEWLTRNVSKSSFVFVYFAGHGTPNPEKGDAYLVPYDGEPGYISKLFPLSRFYNSLEKLPSDNIVVALDACFSGAGGRSVIEEGKRPLVAVKIPEAVKKIAVITASAADEISQDLDAKRHGLFTYYFLKGLRGEADANGDNWITLGELYDYCQPKVTSESKKLGYTQTPKVFPELLGEKTNLRLGRVK